MFQKIKNCNIKVHKYMIYLDNKYFWVFQFFGGFPTFSAENNYHFRGQGVVSFILEEKKTFYKGVLEKCIVTQWK